MSCSSTESHSPTRALQPVHTSLSTPSITSSPHNNNNNNNNNTHHITSHDTSPTSAPLITRLISIEQCAEITHVPISAAPRIVLNDIETTHAHKHAHDTHKHAHARTNGHAPRSPRVSTALLGAHKNTYGTACKTGMCDDMCMCM